MTKNYLFLFLLLMGKNLLAIDTVSVNIVSPSTNDVFFIEDNSVYIIKAESFNTDTLDSIAEQKYVVDGTEIEGYQYGSYYIADWIPTAGSHQIIFEATSTSGDSGADTLNFTVSNTPTDTTVTAFEDTKVKWGGGIGRNVYVTAQLPNHVGAFDSLHAHLSVVCPSGDCDPYDRVAWVEARSSNGEMVEIIRYVTPFGVSCDHELDLTDYLFLLNGEVEFKIFTDTWAGSWEYTLELEYYAGTPEYKYGYVNPGYNDKYFFGDYSNLQPFDTLHFDFAADVEHAQFNFLTSGHAWGSNNTNNAAEFYHSIHNLFLNDDVYEQDPWRTCNPNPDNCSPQSGTWTYNRSGWCPGAVTHPFIYDLDSYLNGGVDIYYQFDTSYVDLCHPNHPNCVTGTTCADCEDTYNPQYWIDANVLEYKNDLPFELQAKPVSIIDREAEKLPFTIYPNPSQQWIGIKADDVEDASFLIYGIDGALVKKVSNYKFVNNNYKIDISNLNDGVYFIEMSLGKYSSVEKLIKQ